MAQQNSPVGAHIVRPVLERSGGLRRFGGKGKGKRQRIYLKTMCADVPYEVLADVLSLPERLPALYRRLAR